MFGLELVWNFKRSESVVRGLGTGYSALGRENMGLWEIVEEDKKTTKDYENRTSNICTKMLCYWRKETGSWVLGRKC